MADRPGSADIAMDADDLYIEESFTDRRVGGIQRLTPVTRAGERDAARPIVYLGQTQIMTPAGALPLSFEIAADSLEDAVAQFGPRAEEALQDTMKRLEEMRREAASSLIVPGSNVPAGGPPIGAPGRGGIKLR
ncbi:MAG TPA: hypothetical protein VLD39_10345 [Gammaproteobacteria bacterium]|nr:hypothetical protein [Gammaproteobacteria bacterium]